MNRRNYLALPGIMLLASVQSMAAEPELEVVNFFEAKIRPVLIEHCYQCHSFEAQKNGKLKGTLRLDTREGLQKGGTRGPAIVPKSPGKGQLLAALRYDGSLKMPPPGKLPIAVIADFEKWIALGAPFPSDHATDLPATVIHGEKARQFWAFQSPSKHSPPGVQDVNWPQTVIDNFILAELEKRHLKPVLPANKYQLIRRATFDLIGLPPTPEEIKNFIKNDSPDAFAMVVDRLLQSPHYGERWARYWLDLSRYADDEGVAFLKPIANAYLYRDWVIRAFNHDMSYNEFIRLQLAGDQISEPTTDYFERLGGLGFQGLGPQFRKGAAGEAKAKADELEDRVATLSVSLLGLSVSCARCHDHKFDPIPTRDYYSLAAAYNGATWDQRMLASPETVLGVRNWDKEVADQKAMAEQLLGDEVRRIGRGELPRIDVYLITAWKLRVLRQHDFTVDETEMAKSQHLIPPFLARWVKAISSDKPLRLMDQWQMVADRAAQTAVAKEGVVQVPASLHEATDKLKHQIVEALHEQERFEQETREKKAQPKPVPAVQRTLLKVFLDRNYAAFKVTGDAAVALLNEPLRKRYDEHQEELKRLQKAAPHRPPETPSVSGGGEAMRVFVRGNPDEPGEPAPPGFLGILCHDKQVERKQFTRLDLADAIASRENPLTARVIVNRVWHYHFGRGIVGSLGNFGQLGNRPTHPELLDTLAVMFMESGWSVKKLHREIMLSATYQLSSDLNTDNVVHDADNHYLWRVSPRRLDAEAFRDAMLAIAGRLDARLGGPSLNSKNIVEEDGEFPGLVQLPGLDADDPTNGRRTVYCIVSRYAPNATLTLFDFPEPNVTSDRRTTTTSPQQQLFVLNSPFVIKMSRSFANRLQAAATDEQRLQLSWQLAYGRSILPHEMTLGLQFLRLQQTAPAEKMTPWEQLCQAIFSSNEFLYVD